MALDVFPVVDPVGPADAEVALPHPELLVRLAAGAEAADRDGVPRATLDAFADAGLLGPVLQPAAAQRELAERIAGCDATTWFCWVQHQTPTRTLAGEVAGLVQGAPDELRTALLPGLQSGRLVGAVAFAHVRRPGPPNPSATRVDGGWRLDGTLDWVTSWDIADVVMVMAQGTRVDADRLVCVYLPAGHADEETPGVLVGEPLELLSMSGTHTRPLTLDGVVVPDALIGAVLDRETWLAADAVRTCDANPAAFGVARGAIAEVWSLGQQRSDAAMTDAAHALADECRSLRARAYALADADGPLDERLQVRAASLDLAVRATTAAVVARAGAGMRAGCDAERRAREALFLQVQAQTARTRAASLELARLRAIPGADLQ